jgi:YHS domain-containing protein
MRAIVFLLQLVFWLFVARLVIRTLARLFPVGDGPARPRTAAPRAAAPRQIEDLVLDRVCHTHVPRSHALTARIAGVEEHFCSETCRDKAKAEVARAS